MRQDDGMHEFPTLRVRVGRLQAYEFLDHLTSATEQFADLVANGDLEARVSACPDWTFAKLVGHLGEIHQWAVHAVVVGNPDARPTPPPHDRAGLVQWYTDAAGTLLSTLRATDPQAPAWAFGPKPRTASFWFRRQTHEATVHLWDAATSQRRSAPIDERVALDGLDEAIGMFFPRQVRLGRIPALEHSLALQTGAETRPDRWVLAGDGTGPAGASDAPAQAGVTGPAEALLLLVWGRTDLDDPRLVLSGDEAAARAVLSAAVVP
jgi:uncharacterized protein (TIGR03083 family)